MNLTMVAVSRLNRGKEGLHTKNYENNTSGECNLYNKLIQTRSVFVLEEMAKAKEYTDGEAYYFLRYLSC